jgi:hypothetical protein
MRLLKRSGQPEPPGHEGHFGPCLFHRFLVGKHIRRRTRPAKSEHLADEIGQVSMDELSNLGADGRSSLKLGLSCFCLSEYLQQVNGFH